MPPIKYNELIEDSEYYQDLGKNIWLVDNHKWALYIWELFRESKKEDVFSLIHIDYHWDAGNDFFESPKEEQELIDSNPEKIKSLIQEEIWIKYDSFIAPAVIRGYVDDVHFYCLQYDDYDIGIDSDTLEKYSTKQSIHKSIDSLVSENFDKPLIFDFCLDVFSKSDDMMYVSDIWNDKEIIDFIYKCKELVEQASIVTVSLSFGYSGSEEDTRHLAELVVPLFLEWSRHS